MLAGDAIRSRREEKGMSAYRLAEDSGVPRSTISEVESGKQVPSEEVVSKVCMILEMDRGKLQALADIDRLGFDRVRNLLVEQAHYLAGIADLSPQAAADLTELGDERVSALWDEEKDAVRERLAAPASAVIFSGAQAQLPFFGKVGCGKFLILDDHPEEMLLVPKELARDGDALVEAVGDSMLLAGIAPGDMLVVRRQDVAEHGQVVLATIPYQGTTVKRLEVRPDGPWLVSQSPSVYPEVKVEGEVRVVGVVRHAWKHKRF